MAYEQNLHPITVPASGDLSAGQWKGVVLDGNGRLVLSSVLGKPIIGVLQDKPTVLGEASEVGVVSQVTKALAGAAFNAGAELMVDATGRFITATAGSGYYVVGHAMQAAPGAGAIVSVFLPGPYYKA